MKRCHVSPALAEALQGRAESKVGRPFTEGEAERFHAILEEELLAMVARYAERERLEGEGEGPPPGRLLTSAAGPSGANPGGSRSTAKNL